jgi:hypothetical protein
MEGGVNTCEGCPVDADFLSAYNIVSAEKGNDPARLERIVKLRKAFDERARITKDTSGECPESKPAIVDGRVICPLSMSMNTLSLLLESSVPFPRPGSASPITSPVPPPESANGDRYTSLERQGYN